MINLRRVGSQHNLKVKHNLIDAINELIIWQINPLVVAATSMRTELFTITYLYSVRLKEF